MWNQPINEKHLLWRGYIWISGWYSVSCFSCYDHDHYLSIGFPQSTREWPQRLVTLDTCEKDEISESWERQSEGPHNNDWHRTSFTNYNSCKIFRPNFPKLIATLLLVFSFWVRVYPINSTRAHTALTSKEYNGHVSVTGHWEFFQHKPLFWAFEFW